MEWMVGKWLRLLIRRGWVGVRVGNEIEGMD